LLIEESVSLLDIEAVIIKQGIELEISEGYLIEEEIDGVNCLFTKGIYKSESEVASLLGRLVTGSVSKNLDLRMCGPDFCRSSFAAGASLSEVAVVEGVMGCFDGPFERDGFGSTVYMAEQLGIPVILVIDASRMCQTAGAVAEGIMNHRKNRAAWAGVAWPTWPRRVTCWCANSARAPWDGSAWRGPEFPQQTTEQAAGRQPTRAVARAVRRVAKRVLRSSAGRRRT